MFVKDTDPATFLAVNETYMVPHAFKLKLLEADSTLNDLNTHLNVVLSLYGKKGRKKRKRNRRKDLLATTNDKQEKAMPI